MLRLIPSKIKQVLAGLRGTQVNPSRDTDGFYIGEGFCGKCNKGFAFSRKRQHFSKPIISNEVQLGALIFSMQIVTGPVFHISVENISCNHSRFANSV